MQLAQGGGQAEVGFVHSVDDSEGQGGGQSPAQPGQQPLPQGGAESVSPPAALGYWE